MRYDRRNYRRRRRRIRFHVGCKDRCYYRAFIIQVMQKVVRFESTWRTSDLWIFKWWTEALQYVFFGYLLFGLLSLYLLTQTWERIEAMRKCVVVFLHILRILEMSFNIGLANTLFRVFLGLAIFWRRIRVILAGRVVFVGMDFIDF